MNIYCQLMKLLLLGSQLFIVLIFLTLTACTCMPVPVEEKNNQEILAKINIQLGMSAIEKEDMENAKIKLQTAVRDAPKLPESWYSLAYFMQKTGQKHLANTYYLKAIKLAPHRGDVHNNYANYLCSIHHYQNAFYHFKKAAKYSGNLDAASAYTNAAECALQAKDKKLSKKYFALAQEQNPSHQMNQSEKSL